MNIQKIAGWIGLILVGAVLTGCGTSTTNSSSNPTTEADLILASIDGDSENSALFASDSFGEDETGSAAFKPEMEKLDAVEPVNATSTRWFRKMDPPVRAVDPKKDAGGRVSTSTATSTVIMTNPMTGNLFLDVPDVGVSCPRETKPIDCFGKKPIAAVGVRTAQFEINDKAATSSKERRKLIAVSPMVISLKDPSKQTIHIRQVVLNVIESSNASSTTGVKLDITDPTLPLPVPKGIPEFRAGDVVLVTAKIHREPQNGTPMSKVYLHRNTATSTTASSTPKYKREPMFDDGLSIHGDVEAGDGVFSILKTLGPGLGGNNSFAIDAIDAEVFDDETTPNYNSAGWILSYRVHKPIKLN